MPHLGYVRFRARSGAGGRLVGAMVALLALAACGAGANHTSAPASHPTPASLPASTGSPVIGGPAAPRTTVTVTGGRSKAPFDVSRTLSVPAGAAISVWARVDGARFATWTPAGDLLISTPSRGSVQRLHPTAGGVSTTTLVSGLNSPQGMAFDQIAGRTYLYVIEADQLDRYDWTGSAVRNRTVLISGLPGDASGYHHPLKNVVAGPDHTIYLDVASSSNADPADRENGQALIASYRPDGTGRTVLMTGVRNGDGLSLDPNGRLWTAVNMRDQISFPQHAPFGGSSDAYGKVIQAYVNDHPADEIAKVTPGRDLGWPYCDPDQDLSTRSDPFGQMQFRRNTVTNPTGAAKDCAALQPLERGIPAHSAPLGLHFLQTSKLPAAWRAGAVVATHGSNGHEPPLAGSVLWMPWTGSTLGPVEDLVTGFMQDGTRWGRPVDAVPGPDGALYITDDTAGAIYRLTL